MTPVRYLSVSEKASLIAGWERSLTELPADYNEQAYGGRGYPDVSMVPWCARINAIEGVCTEQSCCGHILKSNIDGAEYKELGCLWLRPSSEFSAAFERLAFELVTAKGIDCVNKRYMSWGEEILEIYFEGPNVEPLIYPWV